MVDGVELSLPCHKNKEGSHDLMMITMLNLTLFVGEILVRQRGRWVLFAVCQAYILSEGELLIRYFQIRVLTFLELLHIMDSPSTAILRYVILIL